MISGQEKNLLDRYIGHIDSMKTRIERDLLDAGYDPEVLPQMYEGLVDEMTKHYDVQEQISENRIKRLKESGKLGGFKLSRDDEREKSMEDYLAFWKKQESIYGDRLYEVSWAERAVLYSMNDDCFKMSPRALRYCATGLGAEFVFHEKHHQNQRKRLGRIDSLYYDRKIPAFLEGDADLVAMNSLGSAESLKEKIQSYGALSQKLTASKKWMESERDSLKYTYYLISPAVVYDLKSKGLDNSEIMKHFEEVYTKVPPSSDKSHAVKLRDALIESLDKV